MLRIRLETGDGILVTGGALVYIICETRQGCRALRCWK